MDAAILFLTFSIRRHSDPCPGHTSLSTVPPRCHREDPCDDAYDRVRKQNVQPTLTKVQKNKNKNRSRLQWVKATELQFHSRIGKNGAVGNRTSS